MLGLPGAIGSSGLPGATGKTGATGATGSTGATGVIGPPGMSRVRRQMACIHGIPGEVKTRCATNLKIK